MPGPVCFKAVNKTDKKPSHASLHSSGRGRQRIPEINKVSSELVTSVTKTKQAVWSTGAPYRVILYSIRDKDVIPYSLVWVTNRIHEERESHRKIFCV